MVFSDRTLVVAFQRSGGRCECTRTGCGHGGRCPMMFTWPDRLRSDERGWRAARRPSAIGGLHDEPDPCLVVCVPCAVG